MSFLPRYRLAAGIFAALVGTLLLAAPAYAGAAAPSHSFLFTLTGTAPPPNPPKLPPWENYSPNGSFEDACGAAVDSAGDIYLSDYYHDAVDVYDSSLGFLTQIAAENPIDGPCGIAVDNNPASPSFGDVYVNNWRENVVKFTPSEFPPQPAINTFPPQAATSYSGTVIDPGRATGVAVDSHGNVFVDERTDVAEYDPSGALVQKIGEGALGSAPGSGYGVAVSSFPATEGHVYVADAAEGTIKVFDPSTSLLNPVQVIDGAGTPQGGFSSLVDSSLAVAPTDGHLYVADSLPEPFEHPAELVDEFNAAGAYRGQLPHAIVAGEPSGLAVGETGVVYVTSGNSEEAALYGFGPTFSAHTLEVSRIGAGEGTVTSQPAGIACGQACAAEYNAGEEVTLTATPAPGSAFAGWSGGGCAGAALCHLTLAADTAVSAEFEVAPAAPLAIQAPAAKAAANSPLAPATGAAPAGPPVSHLNPNARRRHHPHRHKRRGPQAKRRSG